MDTRAGQLLYPPPNQHAVHVLDGRNHQNRYAVSDGRDRRDEFVWLVRATAPTFAALTAFTAAIAALAAHAASHAAFAAFAAAALAAALAAS